jgi:hypothetical protein
LEMRRTRNYVNLKVLSAILAVGIVIISLLSYSAFIGLQAEIDHLRVQNDELVSTVTSLQHNYTELESEVAILKNSTYEGYDYLIFQQGNTYYAKNGLNGSIDFWGADAAAVIQSAINANPENGTIMIKDGYYPIDRTINLTAATTLEGENKEIELTAVNGADFTPANGIPTIHPFLNLWDVHNVVIENIGFDGNGVNCTAIYIGADFSYDSIDTVVNVNIENFSEYGLYIQQYPRDNTFQNVYIVRCGFYGVEVDSSDQHFTNVQVGWAGLSGFMIKGEDNYFTNCVSWGSGEAGNALDNDGFYIVNARQMLIACDASANAGNGFLLDGANYTMLSSCIARDNGDTHVASASIANPTPVSGFDSYNSTNMVLTGCTASNELTPPTQAYGYVESNASDYNLITGCNFVGNSVGAIMGPLGSHTVITDVTGYGSTPGGPASYVFFARNSTYYAQDGLTGQTLSNSNFTALFLACENSLPTDGGLMFLKSGDYYGHVVLDRDGITLEGETTFNSVPSGIPDNPPTQLYGSTIHPEAGYDGIHISGQVYGIIIENLGVEFDSKPTGNGISTDMNVNQYTITACIVQNVKILNCDSSHYALQFENFLDVQVSQVMAWGGPLLNLYGNYNGSASGNSVFSQLYGYINYTITPISFNDGPYPIFIHVNETLDATNQWMNLMTLTRLQVNDPTTQNDSSFYECAIWNCRYTTFNNLDLEGVNTNKIEMRSDLSVTFNNAYLWSMSPAIAYLNVAPSDQAIDFVNCYLGSVSDENYTDTYQGCTFTGSIDPKSLANFVDMQGNSGEATLYANETSLKVNSTFMGSNYAVIITQQFGNAMNSNETLIVQGIQFAPVNTFTVAREDNSTGNADITFAWKVISLSTP